MFTLSFFHLISSNLCLSLKMNPRLFPTVSVSFVVITITLIHFPFALDANTEEYQNCRAPFQCAGFRSLSYPFWGSNRPSYCGHPAFELNCSGEDPLIKIMDMNYRVLQVNVWWTLTVAREDYWQKFCPATILNTTIDFTIFSYSSGTTNLTIYYGCPLPSQRGPLVCPINGTEFATYTAGNNIAHTSVNTLGMCRYNVKFPVLRSAVRTGINLTEAALVDAIDGGFMLGWDANNTLCDRCRASGGLCGYHTSTSDFACFCADETSPSECDFMRPSNMRWRINWRVPIVIVVGVVGGTVAVCFLAIICDRKRNQLVNLIKWKRDRTNNQFNIEEMMENIGSLGPKQYTYSEVKKLTNSFKDKVGQGGYGSVYKGKLSNGRIIAVKILNESKSNGEDFINEVASISRTSHVNIVTLLGFCYEKTRRALIYEFVLNGSLDKLLYDKGTLSPNSHLDNKTMFQIAIGIARGLEYLHQGCNTRILHFDIKPHNILLDEDLCPKISDFGLAKLCEPKESIVSMTGMRGTAGYIAPEIFNRYYGKVSHKSDVYSYGMLVLEMNGARKKIDTRDSHSTEVYFPNGIYNKLEQGESFGVFDDVVGEEEDIIKKMIIVSLWCIQINPSNRPSMDKVIEMLEGSLQCLQVPPKPSFGSPNRSPEDSSTTSLSQNPTFQMPSIEL